MVLFRHLCQTPMWRGLVLVLGLAAWLGGAARGGAQPAQTSGVQLKAAILFNFPKYVDWPATAFADTNSPLVLAVCDAEDVAAELRALLEARRPGGRPVEVRSGRAETVLAGPCHLAFLGGNSRRQTAEVLRKLSKASVVTVSERDDFFTLGGMIHLARQEKKYRLEVNLPAVEETGLKLSSRLLSVANVVRVKPD